MTLGHDDSTINIVMAIIIIITHCQTLEQKGVTILLPVNYGLYCE